MSSYKKEIYFLNLVAYNRDINQILSVLKKITPTQYKILKNTATNLLQGKLSLTKSNYIYLKRNKLFIRKLSQGKSSKLFLRKNFKVLRYLIKILLEQNEVCGQICVGTNSKMERIKQQPITRSFSRSDSESISSQFSSTGKSESSDSTAEETDEEQKSKKIKQIKSNSE